MSHQHKVTISGVVFYVEDCCKALLANHLKLIYSNNTLKKTAVNIEERVAELLLEELKQEGKQVVTTDAVQHLINKTKHLAA